MGLVEPWLRVVAWLQENAPATAGVLRGPTSAELPDRPATLRSWFEAQGGVGRDPRGAMLFGFMPLSFDEAAELAASIESNIATWGDWAVEEYGDGTLLAPIAESGTTTLLVVDLRPGFGEGAVKELDWEDPSALDLPLWGSVEAMLDDLAHCLEGLSATDAFAVRPVVSSGVLTWLPHFTNQPPQHLSAASEAGPPFWLEVERQAAHVWMTQGASAAANGLGPELDRLLAMDPDELRRAADADLDGVGTVDLDALIAACVHEAYQRVGMRAPAWSTERWRFMRPGSWTLTDFPSAVLRAERATPTVFAEHGISLRWSGPPASAPPAT